MTIPLQPLLLDPADNPYLPRSQHTLRLALSDTDLAFLHPFSSAPAEPAIFPIVDQGEISASGAEDIDDSSSDILDPLEDHEFPGYFQQFGSPPRLFHPHGSSYVLPVDSDETKRQEAQHILLRMIIGGNYDAPVRELLNANPGERKVVDLCTGAGHWVLEMATEFPHVRFRGLDLVPIQTRYPPDNVRFEIADVTQRLCFADASVDVVHARMACIRGDAVPGFLREVARILRPGGLFLSAEWDARPILHPWVIELDEDIPSTTSFSNIASNVVPTLAQNIPALIRHTGAFEQPVSRHRAIPISPAGWLNGLRFVSEVMERVMKGYANALVGRGYVSPDVADNFEAELSERNGIVWVYQTVFARKK